MSKEGEDEAVYCMTISLWSSIVILNRLMWTCVRFSSHSADNPDLLASPTHIVCPKCQSPTNTNVDVKNSSLTHISAIIMCLIGWWWYDYLLNLQIHILFFIVQMLSMCLDTIHMEWWVIYPRGRFSPENCVCLISWENTLLLYRFTIGQTLLSKGE